jgi:glycosyltransferase involved in cell wall biosynthesis
VNGEVVVVAGRDPLSEPGGGHSRYVAAHARAALRAGYCPHLFCVAPDSGQVETDFGIIHRVASPFRPFRQLMVAGHAPRLASAIEAFARTRQGPLVIHGFGVWGYAGVLAQERLARRGIRAIPILSSYTTYLVEARAVRRATMPYPVRSRILAAHQELWVRIAVRRLERRAYRGSRLVLVNYETIRRMIADQFGPDVACRKVPYASESAFLREDERSAGSTREAELRESGARAGADPPLIVMVARHEPRKGGSILLRALARLRDQGIPFRACLAGTGMFLDEHRRLARRLHLDDVVRIPGLVADAFGLIAQADIFVLSSLSEQSGSLALLEALQAGRAIVASGVDGILEDVTDDHDALLVPPGDEARLAQTLTRVLLDEALRRRLGARARETFEGRFSARAFAASIGELYRELGDAA